MRLVAAACATRNRQNLGIGAVYYPKSQPCHDPHKPQGLLSGLQPCRNFQADQGEPGEHSLYSDGDGQGVACSD